MLDNSRYSAMEPRLDSFEKAEIRYRAFFDSSFAPSPISIRKPASSLIATVQL